MEIFVPDYDWNCQWESVEASVSAGQECGDFSEGDEFRMVRITVGACTTYRIVDGKAVPVTIAFPECIQPPRVGDGKPSNNPAKGA